MKKIALFSVFMCVVFAVSAAEPVQTSEVYGNAQVSATKLNLRMKPTIKSPRAGSIMKGTRVKVTAKKDGWLELEAPSSMPVYVSAVYLINGKLSNATKLRPTNDPNAPSFGVYPAGTKLKAIGSVDKFGWIKVEPPAGLLVYAYGDYIAIDKDAVIGEKKESKPAEAAPAPEKKDGKSPAEVKKPAAEKAEKPAGVKKPAAEKSAEVKKSEEKKVAKPAEVKKPAAKKAEKPAVAVKEASPEKMKQIRNDLGALKAVADKELTTISGALCKIGQSTTSFTEYAVVDRKTKEGIFVCGISDDFYAANTDKDVTVTGRIYRVKRWKSTILVFEKKAEK